MYQYFPATHLHFWDQNVKCIGPLDCPLAFPSLPHWWAPLQPQGSPPSTGRPSRFPSHTLSLLCTLPHPASAAPFLKQSPSLQQPSGPSLLPDIISTSASIFLLSNIFPLCFYSSWIFESLKLNLWGNQQGSGPTANLCTKQYRVPSISSEAIHNIPKWNRRQNAH